MKYREMIRIYLLVSLLICNTLGADHGTFKDCGRVEFCTNLRQRAPENLYSVNAGSVQHNGALFSFTLSSNQGDLSATLTSLQDNTLRIEIQEPESNRYKLQDVLDGEPETLNMDGFSSNDNFAEINIGPNTIVINYSPFSISFAKDGLTTVVFEGQRLILQDLGATKPFAFGVQFPGATQLYGVHEHADHLALQNTGPGGVDPYRLKNSDVANYELNSPMALYGAVPVIYANSPSSTAGIFFQNAAEQWIDINNNFDGGSEVYFMAETGSLDLFVFLGPEPVQVVRQYTRLTGTAHLPQLWTLGYHQSRYSYDTQDDVKNVAANFDSANLPLDVIWLDIDYSDGYKYFTWNPNTFSNPEEMQQTLSDTGKRLVTIIDPHIKVENGYGVYDGALSRDLFVKNADGSVFQGPCWPGTSSYMDFLNPEARDYYASMYHYENFAHSTPVIAGIWNDMNEPSVFDSGLEMTLPADSVHFGGVQHRELHNIYGFLHTRSTHQGLLERDNSQVRPFVLTRSHFAGSQRFTALWTGDNTADWGYLSVSYSECLSANLLGLVFCGADVGGFFGNPNDELFQRWYQAGAWLPFYRAHSEKTTNRREPYLYPEDIQAVIRNAIQTRYQHIPVWYTLFYEHTRTGDPIIRPLWYHYRSDATTFNIDDHLLVGRDILVRAIAEPGVSSVQVYLPGVEDRHWWYSLTEEILYEGGHYINVPVDMQAIPVFYRGGSVISRKDTVRSNTNGMINDGYTIYVTLDQSSTANGTVYLDDNVSFKYRDSKEYNYVQITVALDSISIYPVDDDATGDFEFVVDEVVYTNYHARTLKDGKAACSKKVYNKDTNGKLLKDMKFNLKQKTVIKL